MSPASRPPPGSPRPGRTLVRLATLCDHLYVQLRQTLPRALVDQGEVVRTYGTVDNEHQWSDRRFAHYVWLQDAQRLVRHASVGKASPVEVVKRQAFVGHICVQRMLKRREPLLGHVPKRVDYAVLLWGIAWLGRHPVQHVQGVGVLHPFERERTKQVNVATEHERVVHGRHTMTCQGNVLELCPRGLEPCKHLHLLALVPIFVQAAYNAHQVRQMCL